MASSFAESGYHSMVGLILAVTLCVLAPTVWHQRLSARVVPAPGQEPPWVHIDDAQISSGTTVPPGTNVLFHLPIDTTPISREVLLGGRGPTVRYWGYCLPENYGKEVVHHNPQLPGQMFFSEKELDVQRARFAQLRPASILHPPLHPPDGSGDGLPVFFQHRLEVFQPGSLCYIMTESPLAMGLDPDGDGLNNKLEHDLGTDPHNQDTDGDGIPDGIEYFHGTNPLLRDTDGDGLIDGIEDRNHNGIVDPGETDPRTRDSDRDGLCDGLCLVRLANGQMLYIGEDMDLNGKRDKGEYDPTTPYTLMKLKNIYIDDYYLGLK